MLDFKLFLRDAVHVSQVGGFYTEGIKPYTIINNLTVFGIAIKYFEF